MSDTLTPVLIVFLVLGIVVAASALVAAATIRAQRRRSRSSDIIYDVVAFATIDTYLRRTSPDLDPTSYRADSRGALQMRRDDHVAQAMSGLTGSELAHNPDFHAAFRAGVMHAADLPPVIDPGRVDEVLDRVISNAVTAELSRRSGSRR